MDENINSTKSFSWSPGNLVVIRKFLEIVDPLTIVSPSFTAKLCHIVFKKNKRKKLFTDQICHTLVKQISISWYFY